MPPNESRSGYPGSCASASAGPQDEDRRSTRKPRRLARVRSLAKTWSAIGRRGIAALILVGGVLVAEAIMSHVRDVGWSGHYGWQRVLMMAVGVIAILAGAVRAWQSHGEGFSQNELAGIGAAGLPFFDRRHRVLHRIRAHVPRPLEGDQPHYELQSVGLAYEQTRDMTKDYALPDRFHIMFPLGLPSIEAACYKPGGELVGEHNVGLPLLLAPLVPWVEEAGSSAGTATCGRGGSR